MQKDDRDDDDHVLRQRMRRPRRRMVIDPAMSAFLQLLALLGVLFGKAPLLPRPVFSWPVTPYERGEGGSFLLKPKRQFHGRYRTRPSYRRLVSDLRRPAARKDAEEILRARVPADVLPWLHDVIEREDWWQLSMSVRGLVPDDEAELRMMQQTLAWLRDQDSDDSVPDDAPEGNKKLRLHA